MVEVKRVVKSLFEYETSKQVVLRSHKIGYFCRLLQFIILVYIAGYVIAYKHGYQSSDSAYSATTSKVKGISFTKVPNHFGDRKDGKRIWDTADYVRPPQENNAFFVLTNAIITPSQVQGVCAEDPDFEQAICEEDKHCHAGETSAGGVGNGIMTGKCRQFNDTSDLKTCEIHAWCPVETDELHSDTPLLKEAVNFTVLIKNFVEFAKFHVKRRNLVDSVNNATYLKQCRYNADSDPLCPVFRIGDIVSGADANFTELGTAGGVINIVIKWDCDLDKSEEKCIPTYSFSRLDNPSVKIASGWNFRYADYYRNSNSSKQTRDLYKAYGILFVVTVQSSARKFDVVPLILNVASGLALMSLCPLICDMLLIYCVPSRRFYTETKYQTVDVADLDTGVERDDSPMRHRRLGLPDQENE